MKESTTQWIEAQHIRPGMVIATERGWEPVTTVYKSGRKQTFDIEVENTHNFVGNGIVAHKTYLQGAGTTTGFSLRTADSAGTDRFAVLDGGNVGIGTTSPSSNLSVSGNADFTGSVGIGTASPTFDKLYVLSTVDDYGATFDSATNNTSVSIKNSASGGRYYRLT